MKQKPFDVLNARWWILSILFAFIFQPLMVIPLWVIRQQAGVKAMLISFTTAFVVLGLMANNFLVNGLLLSVIAFLLIFEYKKASPLTSQMVIELFSPFLLSLGILGSIFVLFWFQIKCIELNNFKTEALTILDVFKISPENYTSMVEEFTKNVVGAVFSVLIMFYVIMQLAFAYANYYITKNIQFFNPILSVHLPKMTIWLLFLFQLLTLTKNPVLESVGRNFSTIGLMLFFLQGVFVVIKFTKGKLFSGSSFLLKGFNTFFLTIICISLSFLVFYLGIIDQWVDFRKVREINSN